MDQTLYIILAAAVLVTVSFILITIGSNGLGTFDDKSSGFLDLFGDRDSTGELLGDLPLNNGIKLVETLETNKYEIRSRRQHQNLRAY
jgi:hypothetical protein